MTWTEGVNRLKTRTVSAEILATAEVPEELRQAAETSPDHLVRKDGKIYLLLGGTVISLPDDPDGNEMLYSIIRTNDRKDVTRPLNACELFRMMLTDPRFIPDQSILKKHRIDPAARRCVVVFRADIATEHDLYTLFRDIVPMEEDDTAVPVDYHTVAFIRNTTNRSVQDLTEYTYAVIGSMEDEGISGIRAGAGMEAPDLAGLRQSYLQALEALSTGIRYHGQDSVFLYAGQTLERIVDSIPPQRRKEIRDSFLHSGSAGLLSSEMLETVRVFFRNDLNLTAASKQLFIHRNTLNYRLDKIRKDTGLDLRHFQDAVIFRIIIEIPEV